MLKFTSEADLLRLNPAHPAKPIIQELVHRIITMSRKTEYPYDPDADGFIALIEQDDVDRPLSEIWGEDAYSLINTPWEGITKDESGKFFLAVFLANNQYGIVFVIPDADWIHGELRECIEAHLDENINSGEHK